MSKKKIKIKIKIKINKKKQIKNKNATPYKCLPGLLEKDTRVVPAQACEYVSLCAQ